MPPSSGTPGSFEETLSKQEMYEAVMKEVQSVPSADVLWQGQRSLSSFGILRSVATETRDRLLTLLGEKDFNEVVGRQTERLTPQIVTNIIGRMAETNHGIHALLENVIEDPKQAAVTTSAGKVKLSTLIRDPESKEAPMLAWFMENVAKNKTSAEKEAAFGYLNNDTEVNKLQAIMKARKLYDSLSKDEESFDIGKTGSPPNTQIGRIENRKADAQTKLTGLRAAMLSAKPKVAVLYPPQIDRVEESIDKMEGEIYNLDKKRASLTSKLTEFEAAMKQVDSAFALGADRDAQLNKAALLADLASAATPIGFAGGPSRPAHKYFTDDELRAETDAYADAYTKSGKQKPRAKDALQRLMEIEYADVLKDMEADKRAAFMQNLQRILSTASGTSAGNTNESAAAEDKTKKPSDKNDGGSKGASGKTSLIGSVFGVVTNSKLWQWLNDDSKDLLGFDVKSKGS